MDIKKYDFITGIPCSKLKGLTDSIEKYIPCTREDESVAMAAGAYLVGKKPLVFMQNSGLGNCVDIIASLLKPYGIEIDMVVSRRTEPAHHMLMGNITGKLLNLVNYEAHVEVIE